MNIFIKNKVITGVLAGLLIISLAALGTISYHHYKTFPGKPFQKECGQKCDLLTRELGLSAEQERTIGKIREEHNAISRILADSIRKKRSDIVTELSLPSPDTARLNKLANEAGALHSALINQTTQQFLRISKECTPEQRDKLSSLYYELMGCCKAGEGKQMMEECRKKCREGYICK